MGQTGALRDVRYKVYQVQTATLRPSSPFAIEPVFLMVTDEEFWKGPLARRRPLKRNYIADLVTVAAASHPRAIALDFDFRSPTPDGKVTYTDYDAETKALLDAIDHAAQEVPVILPKTIRPLTNEELKKLTKESGKEELPQYAEENDIFSGHDFHVKPQQNAVDGHGLEQRPPRIFHGYIQLAYDLRQIPPKIPLLGRGPMDSFSLAILHATEPDSYNTVVGEAPGNRSLNLKFGSFLPSDDFTKRLVSAALTQGMAEANRKKDEASRTADEKRKSELLAEAKALEESGMPSMEKMRSRVVILCGSWHENAYNEGPLIDQHFTPVGNIPGGFVHANYVEAMRTGFYYPAVPEWLVDLSEIILVSLAAIVVNIRSRGLYKLFATVLPLIAYAALGYFFVQNLGVFFEFLLPLLVIAGHFALEKVLEWRRLAVQAQTPAHAPLAQIPA